MGRPLHLIRALLGAPLLVLLASEQFSLAWLLLLFGAFTDWADGWMARRADGGSSWEPVSILWPTS